MLQQKEPTETWTQGCCGCYHYCLLGNMQISSLYLKHVFIVLRQADQAVLPIQCGCQPTNLNDTMQRASRLFHPKSPRKKGPRFKLSSGMSCSGNGDNEVFFVWQTLPPARVSGKRVRDQNHSKQRIEIRPSYME
jgi:hypothetical protein